jgi:hypothetical protein
MTTAPKKRVGAAPVELDSESEPLTNKLESIYTYSQARGPQPLVKYSPSPQSSQSIKLPWFAYVIKNATNSTDLTK